MELLRRFGRWINALAEQDAKDMRRMEEHAIAQDRLIEAEMQAIDTSLNALVEAVSAIQQNLQEQDERKFEEVRRLKDI